MQINTGITRRIVALMILATTGCGGPAGQRGPLPAEINARKAAAQRYMDAGEFASAAAELQPLADQGVKNGQLHAMLGECQWKLGARDAAVASYEAALRLHFSDSEIHLDFASLLMEMGRVGRALTEFELAVDYNDGEPLPHYNYGLALYQLGRREEAVAQWQMAVDLDPEDARFNEALGIGLTGVDDRAALGHFERARTLGADSPSFWNNFGLLLRRGGDITGARDAFEVAVGRDSTAADYRFNLAAAHMSLQEFERARPLWAWLRSHDRDNPTVITYLGRSQYELGHHREAIGTLEAWANAQPVGRDARSWSRFDEAARGDTVGIDEAFDVLAMSYRALGDLEKARLYIERALEVAPQNIVHLNNYGVILAESGNIDGASVQWRKVLAIEPHNRTARENLSAVGR